MGRLGHLNSDKTVAKGSLLGSLFASEREGSQVAFPLGLLWFPEASVPRSARAGVVKTLFSIFGLASILCLSGSSGVEID